MIDCCLVSVSISPEGKKHDSGETSYGVCFVHSGIDKNIGEIIRKGRDKDVEFLLGSDRWIKLGMKSRVQHKLNAWRSN